MKAHYLPIAVKNAAITLEDILPKLPKAELKLLYYKRVTDLYRLVGIGDFFLSNDPDLLAEHLFKSSSAFGYFLQHAADSEKATSLTLPFFDAIVCGDEEGALRLAQLSPTTVNPRKEYEEEFFAVRILMDYFYLNADAQSIDDLLQQYADLDAQNADIRFPIIEGLVKRLPERFQEGLIAFISAYKAQWEGRNEPYSEDANEKGIFGNFSVEVVAWLKLAQRQGFDMSDDYALAPKMALNIVYPHLDDRDSWRQIESRRSLGMM